MNATVYREVPGVVTIAEESTAWPGVTRPTHLGGLGFGFKWNMGWMHDSLAYVAAGAGAPQLPPRPADVLDDVRLLRELRAADQPRRGRLRQGLDAAEDARRPLAAAGQPAGLPGLHVGPPRQAAAVHGLGVRARTPSGPRAARWTGGTSTTRRTAASCSWSPTSTPATRSSTRSGRWTSTRRGFQWIDANDASGNVLSFLRYGKPAAGGRGARGRRAGAGVGAGLRRQLLRLAAPRVPDRPAARRATGARCSTPTPTGYGGSGRRQPRRRRGGGGAVARPAVLGDGGRSPAGHRLVPARGLSPTAAAGAARAEAPGEGSDRAFCAGSRSCRRPDGRPHQTRGRAPMRQVLRRALPAASLCVLLAGCSAEVVAGVASPGRASPWTSPPTPSRSPASATSRIDQFARNALADLETFWSEAYPEFFGEDYTAARGRLLLGRLRGARRERLPGDRHRLRGLADRRRTPSRATPSTTRPATSSPTTAPCSRSSSTDYGRFLVPVVMAHEFGHAMQGRFGFAASGRSIQDETQADCLAGAWTAWVAGGRGRARRHPRRRNWTTSSAASCCCATTSAATPSDTQAHGSYFDRVSAFYEGFDGGVGACRDDFGEDRLFTPAAVRPDRGAPPRATRPYDDIVAWVGADPAGLLGRRCSRSPSARTSTRRRSRRFDTHRPRLRRRGSRTATWASARPTTTVYVRRDRARPARATTRSATSPSRPRCRCPTRWPCADQAGLSTDDGAATRSAVCLTGWYDRPVVRRRVRRHPSDAAISPGDIDEAVQFLLTYGVEDQVFPNVSTPRASSWSARSGSASSRAATPATSVC